MGTKYALALLTVVLICMNLSGCALRSAVIKDDQVEYNAFVANSISKQMVLNLVRERYIEMPYFLQAPAITSGFTYNASVGLGAAVPEANASLTTQGIHTFLPTFTNSISLSPTIQYIPLDGEKYVSGVLSEITIEKIALLHSTGWDFDTILRMLVKRIGDSSNYPKMEGGREPETYGKFLEIIKKLSAISNRGDLQFVPVLTRGPSPDGDTAGMETPYSKEECSTRAKGTAKDCKPQYSKTARTLWTMRVHYINEEEAQELERLLEIQSKSYEPYKDRYQESFLLATGGGMDEVQLEKNLPVISIRLRSCEETIFFLAGGVEVPEGDENKAGIVHAEQKPRPSLVKIHVTSGLPQGDFISVLYRQHYFYIDDEDRGSKRAFALLLCLFSLGSGNPPNVTPVLTIPVGTGGQ